MNTVTNDNEFIDASLDRTGDVTADDIAAFVCGEDNEPAEETARRARRVLTQAIGDPVVRERLLWLRSARADWETEARSAEAEEANALVENARLSALQERMRADTLQSAGLGELSETPETQEKPGAVSLWNVWKTGGGRWAAGAAQSARSLAETVQRAGNDARNLVLGGQTNTLSLPCLAPARAASAEEAPTEMHSDAITTADGVRITFQQSPGSGNRMRVLVDASHLTPASGSDGESRPPYNVAFLTLMEGEGDDLDRPKSHSRHLLVVALNARGTGYSDFSVVPDAALPNDAAAQKSFPSPRAGGCRLVSATLSQMPQNETALTG